MATLMLDALLNEGTHNISNINTRGAKPLVNGAILTGDKLDNGLLVELMARDSEGNLQCKAWEGVKDFYIVETAVEEQLQQDLGEYDYKNFYNGVGEIIRLYVPEKFLRQETSAFTVAGGVTLALDLAVVYDVANKKFVVGGTVGAGMIAVGTVVGLDTDFGYNAGKETIRVQYK